MLFASYSRVDRERIQPLLADLHALGHPVWVDEELAGGEVWWQAILAEIRGCRALLFLVSPTSVNSEACAAELAYAMALQRVVIPIEVAATDSSTVPTLLAGHQMVSYVRGDKGDTMALARALARLETERPLPEPLPPDPPVPGTYFTSLRDQLRSPVPMDLEQQLGAVHRLRLRAGLGETEQVAALLGVLRAREDLFASVAAEIAELESKLAAADGAMARSVRRTWSTRPPGERAAAAVTLAAVLVGLLALAGPLWTSDENGARRWGVEPSDPQRWQLVVLLGVVVGAGGVGWWAGGAVRWGGRVAMLGFAVAGLWWWWWRSGVAPMLRAESRSEGAIDPGGGTIWSGVSLGALVVSASLLVTANAPPDPLRHPLARRRRRT